jgi:serine/threonine protein phosphatase PrpC
MLIDRPEGDGARRGEARPGVDDRHQQLPAPSRYRRSDMTTTFESAAVSHAGPRPDNQDSGCAGPHLVAIADGVGGNVGGAIASSLVINWLTRHGSGRPTSEGSAAWLSDAIAIGNRRIRAACAQKSRLKSMATTLTAIATTGDGVLALAHIGDSRAYLLRGGALVQLTRDHTWVQALVDAGSITPQQARTHPLRSVLLAVLHGTEDDIAKLEISTHPTQPGDRLLLCSDGLSGAVPAERMLGILAEAPGPAAAAALLQRAALDAPAQDNVTVAVADLGAVPHSSCEPPMKVGAAASATEESTQPLPTVGS